MERTGAAHNLQTTAIYVILCDSPYHVSASKVIAQIKCSVMVTII